MNSACQPHGLICLSVRKVVGVARLVDDIACTRIGKDVNAQAQSGDEVLVRESTTFFSTGRDRTVGEQTIAARNGPEQWSGQPRTDFLEQLGTGETPRQRSQVAMQASRVGSHIRDGARSRNLGRTRTSGKASNRDAHEQKARPSSDPLGHLVSSRNRYLHRSRFRTANLLVAKPVALMSASTVARRAARTANNIPPLSTKVAACPLAAGRARDARGYKFSSSWVNSSCVKQPRRKHPGQRSADPKQVGGQMVPREVRNLR